MRAPPPDWVTYPLTNRQRLILDRIGAFCRKHKYAPTCRELADLMGIKVSSIFSHLAALERKKYLERVPGVARGLRVLKKP